MAKRLIIYYNFNFSPLIVFTFYKNLIKYKYTLQYFQPLGCIVIET